MGLNNLNILEMITSHKKIVGDSPHEQLVILLSSRVVSPPQTSIGEAPASSFGAFQGAVPAERCAGDGLKHVETHCSSLMILMNMNIKKNVGTCMFIIWDLHYCSFP